MSKRKSSKTKKFDRESKELRGGRVHSFWTNAGQNPMPAVNIDRPFDFDVGFPNDPSKGFSPYFTGSAQYITTTMSIPDDWCNCVAFDLTVERLYQSIRENLKSNLSYTSQDLKAYLASVTWIQAICSTINRDFAFLNFRDAQHPAFEHVWGKYAEAPLRDNYIMTKVTKGLAKDKEYLMYQDIATSLTYIDNVLVPKMRLLLVPPAASEFCRWLFDAIYVDEMNASRAQWYWNEIKSIPMYRYAKLDPNDAAPTFYVAGHLSTYDMTLESLVGYATDIASVYGVIIADLRRCGAQMVSPYIATSTERQAIMKYDDNFFYALRNAYTGGWDEDLNGLNPEFFLVDFYEGMTNEQMCTALCLAGGYANNKELVRPMVVNYQSVLIETDHTQNIFIDPIQSYPGLGSNASLPSPDVAGVYYMSWDSSGTSTAVVSNAGAYDKNDTMTIGINDYGFNGGVSTGTGTINYSPATWVSAHQFIPIFYGYDNNSYDPSHLVFGGLTIAPANWTLAIDEPSAKVYTYSGAPTSFVTPTGTSILISGSTQLNISVAFTKSFTILGPDKWTYNMRIEVGTSTVTSAASMSLYHVSCPGTVYFGRASGAVVAIQYDPSVSVFAWLMQEVDHHIPIRASNCVYDINMSDFTTLTRSLIKETKVSTLYTREELSSLLYSLNLSLFMVHANSRSVKQA